MAHQDFYRPPRITFFSQRSSVACSPLQNSETRCNDCGAEYGHKELCPKLNRNVAEARSVISTGEFNAADQHWLNAIERAFNGESDIDFETRQRG